MEIENILGYLLNTSARLIKHDMEKQLSDFKITTAQWAVLKLLDSWGELTQTEIADKLKSDKATIGSIVTRLRKKDLIVKRLSIKDSRANMICMTEQSKIMVKQIEKLARRTSLNALVGFNKEEKDRLIQALQRIIHNLDEAGNQ
ncbi:MarR family transcriptional regulator [Sporolactobacillus shoreicorticis]|uniref:MarR family winged helix-turn-helix transcriptional regulator n=1 Tax=Sporolactobacillus shoreicorticis TaxID=1923877 RepID=A0ABW5S7Q3_9BACL|nr:MarR family transcriptional regulator [Sporolactobacillus shoreicorticis]MCO7126900.1 MarR family transcriptional regulator [Sporolactobacillus shoreicorticis]